MNWFNEIQNMNWLDTEIVASNTIGHFIAFFTCTVVLWAVGKIIGIGFHAAASKRKESSLMQITALQAAAKAIPLLLLVIGLKLGVNFLELGEPGQGVHEFVTIVMEILLTVAVALSAIFFVSVPDVVLTRAAAKTVSKLDDMLVPIVRKSLKITIWVFALVNIAQVLSNQPVTSIIAGLGIGGLAVALAAQDSIKNIFGSVIIFVDKPFELGERIIYGEHDGIIEEVGLRSTRLRRLDGALVTIPNGDLANSAINNVGRRPNIRRVFHITVTYDTPPEKIREGKAIIMDILKDHEGLDPKGELVPRCFFMDFNDASLGYLCIYWYFPPAWWDYCAFTERVNLEILERFNNAGIDFAFPTQTLYLASDPNRPLKLGINDLKQLPPDLAAEIPN